jgi:hypothetical protein
MVKSLLDQLEEEICNKENVLSVPMHRIRDACGVQRLREYTIQQVATKLSSKGIGHIPRKLPMDQGAPVRLYIQESTVGRFLKVALQPGEAGDEKLRQLAEGGAADAIRQIRDVLDGIA